MASRFRISVIFTVVLAQMLCGGYLLDASAQAASSADTGGQVVLGELPPEYQMPAHASSVVEGKVRFQLLTPSVVRMEYSPTGNFIDASSIAVLKRAWDMVRFEQRQSGDWTEIDTGKMVIRYQRDSGPLTGKNLQVTWKDLQGQHAWRPGDKDDQNLGGVRPTPPGPRSPGGDIAMGQEPVHEPGPLSRNGYFLLDDSHTALWDRASKWVKPRPETDGQDWYFFAYGHDYKQMLSEFAELLGPIPMIPRYVLGAWFMSRSGYSADGWKLNAERLRDESIPVDMLGIDSTSTAKIVWAGRDIDYEQLPDPKQFFHWMLERGIRVFVNEHYGPLTRQNDSHFEEMRKLANLPPDAEEVPNNLANKKYAEAFMGILHRPMLDAGMAFWEQDGWGYATKMPGLDPALWTRYLEYQGSEEITGKRTFDLCRLGEWGSHRYGGYFTGDINSYWSTLSMLVPYHVQSGNTLLPYAASTSTGAHPETMDPELYERWGQFGALSQVFWVCECAWGLRFPWDYDSQALDITRNFLRLRYRLMPYMYTYSRLAHDTGVPLVRGTYLEYPDQDGSYTYSQQYLFGQEVLVAPVVEPGYGKPVLKNVFLPAGERWMDFFTGKIYEGGQVISYLCPIERMPLFVRAGSILPMAPDMDYTDQRPVDPLTLDVYAGKPASFRLYEDDGTSLAYRKGAYAWTPLTYTPGSEGEHTIEIGPSKGEYRSQQKGRRYEVKLHGLLKPEAVKLNGSQLEEKQMDDCGEGCWDSGWRWNDQTRTTTVRLSGEKPIVEKLTLTLTGAGTFADTEMLQKALEYRERVRKVRDLEQLKWALLLHGDIIKRPPRVIRETDAVLSELSDLISHPRGIAQRPVDFRKVTQRLLHAFVDQPFESNRTIPELDQLAIDATKKIEHATFLPEELNRMTAELVGSDLCSEAWGQPSPVVDTKLSYDSSATGPAKVTYNIRLPEEGTAAWMQTQAPKLLDTGFTEFSVRSPFLVRQGTYQLRVKAVLAWEDGQVEVEQDVPWHSNGGLDVMKRHGFTDENEVPDYRTGVLTDAKRK